MSRPDEDDEVPSSLQAVAVSVAKPSVRLRPTLGLRFRLWAAVLLTLVTPPFAILGVLRQASLDVPLPGNVRAGFFENDWPKRWTCAQGHDHWSLPYWMGTVVLVLVCGVAWRVWFVRRRRERSGH